MYNAQKTKLVHVYGVLREQIVGGALQPGERLPTEQLLSEQMGYSRATVATAIRRLVDEGLVERRKRAGSFVRRKQEAGAAVKGRAPLFGALISMAESTQKMDTVFVPITQEIGHHVEPQGYALVMHSPGSRATTAESIVERLREITQRLVDRNVAGVFVLPQEINADQTESSSVLAMEEFDRARIPVVLLDRDIYRFPKRSKYDIVGIDNLRAGYVITEHLIKLGCRRIDFICEGTYASAGAQRVEGFLQALEAHGLDASRERVHYRANMPRHEFFKGLLEQADTKAFVAVNDRMAADLMLVALEMGKRVPEDVRIVGFDDLPQSQYLSSPLTTIRQRSEAIGAAAARMMFDRMENPGRSGVDLLVQFELVVRKSCGAML
ncbi:MAG TPA: GntR family transcriptional regulator [Tepidisphaeraceae bacterium]|jgi:DNA-binding LacI/PurR family transcriptional regulator|nr:GntR family transcriptional regulator [Tepidisphaeraceae bacterium]